jgi:hypothetical protein
MQLAWTVEENCTVHLKNNEQCNSLALWCEQYFFPRKTNIEWIKFTRTVMSILYLIIFYLILLHAQKIMKTVVLIGWILYVMEL